MRTAWRIVLALSAVAVLTAVNGGSIAYAQAEPAFEVSQVTGNRQARISRTPQRIAFQPARLGDIMAFAYGLPLDRIERRPQWMYGDLYDVAVTTAAPAGLPEQKLLVQKLLEQRFGLMVHRISTPSPVYFLVPGAKVDLTETTEPDAADLPEFRTEFPSGPPGGTCVGRRVSMDDLAVWLYPQLQLPVLDKTGITGLFDIEIHGLPLNGGAEGTIRAVRDSLGLDLELHRGTADSLIIDHVEKPKEN